MDPHTRWQLLTFGQEKGHENVLQGQSAALSTESTGSSTSFRHCVGNMDKDTPLHT